MPQLEEHLNWCLKEQKRLVKISPDLNLAKKHINKSKYNYSVMQSLEKLGYHDWALNVGFYSIYHCFLAILAKFGYASRNQSCTVTVLFTLIEEGKINLNKDLVMQFDSLDVKNEMISNTLRAKREISTYGVESSIDIDQLKKIKELILKVQRETIKEIS